MTANNRAFKRKTRERGFSLVTTLSIGMIATLVVSGLLAGILPIYRTVAGDEARLKLKNFVEGAVDYTVAKLNDPEFTSTVSPGDEIGAEPKTVIVTSSELGISGNLSATVVIANEMPTNSSRLFNPSLSPYGFGKDLVQFNQDWSFAASGTKGKNLAWRTITAVANQGSIIETVAVALRSEPSIRNDGTAKNPQPFFKYAALASQNIYFKNGSSTYGFTAGDQRIMDSGNNFALGGDIAAYRQAFFDASSITVGGSLDVPSIDAPSDVSAQKEGPTTVNRYITTKDTAPTFNNSDALGYSNPSAGLPNDTTRPSNMVVESPDLTQGVIPPAPTASSSANSGGDMILTSSTQSGSYVVDSLSMSGGSANLKGVSVYVRDTGAANTVVDLSGDINSSSAKSSADFQIWYNGQGKISVKANSMRGTIYAPNAEVELSSGTSAKGSFKGAIVAKDLTVSNVDLGFDKPMSNSLSQTYDPDSLSSRSSYKVASYKEVIRQK